MDQRDLVFQHLATFLRLGSPLKAKAAQVPCARREQAVCKAPKASTRADERNSKEI